MVSVGRLPEKQRRKFRRANYFAKDLHSVKYRQRIVPDKRRKQKEEWNEDQETD